jgi:hypothetical protein
MHNARFNQPHSRGGRTSSSGICVALITRMSPTKASAMARSWMPSQPLSPCRFSMETDPHFEFANYAVVRGQQNQ